jgi:RsiW-degrading membrane proteinase PrsW (M82 family)
MQKAIQDFLFGIFFGMGFAIANNVLTFIAQFLHAPH